jgi:hypothetical protein
MFNQNVNGLVARAKNLHKPVAELVSKLPKHVRPMEARLYGASGEDADFGDQPWQGEWHNDFNDTFANSSS